MLDPAMNMLEIEDIPTVEPNTDEFFDKISVQASRLVYETWVSHCPDQTHYLQ